MRHCGRHSIESRAVKIYRLVHNGRERVGVGDGDSIHLHSGSYAFDLGDADGERVPLDGALLLPPVHPSKIVAVGRNYADHAKELGNEAPSEPIIFLKPPSALLAPNGNIVKPPQSQRVDFEGELAIVIGHAARHVHRHQWEDVVLGFTCANDVTARDLQKKDVQFTRGKSFDTFLPLGPCIAAGINPAHLHLTTRVNGEVRQEGTTADMIFDVGVIVEFVSAIMSLEPGDVILTGTPAGVGPLTKGDVVEVEIESIGVLRNVVA
jgi:2-keto-4-pentenoate hydratase/2-oxohepta-3-ene-1,7-dioic acid hydratase in catechol pathway